MRTYPILMRNISPYFSINPYVISVCLSFQSAVCLTNTTFFPSSFMFIQDKVGLKPLETQFVE
jgi:hypothetical protein